MLHKTMTALTLALAALAMQATAALAHPHVWVTSKSEVVFAEDGSATGVRHHWTFDEMFSTFATQGLDAKKPGGLTRDDLASLAEVNITSLKDFDFFTHARVDGKKAPFVEPKDYWLDFKDGALTLNFTLPFKTPVKAKTLAFEIYDSSFFVDFAFAKDGAGTLAGTPPPACKVAVSSARDTSATPQKPLGEAFFENLKPDSNFGAQYANRLSVSCP